MASVPASPQRAAARSSRPAAPAAASVSRREPDGRGAADAAAEPGPSMLRLRKRQDFLELRDGRRANAATLTLQARQRPQILAQDGEARKIGRQAAPIGAAETRVGFTVTKKNGG